jgi:transcription elongation factor GreA
MDKNKYITTKQGLDNLIIELKERKESFRKTIADKIEKATALGDLSENASYTAALEEQQMNEAKIAELEDLIKNAEVKKLSRTDAKVDLGDTVTLEDQSGKKVVFTLVGEQETSPKDKKYSLSSPLGAAVFEKKLKSEVTVSLPAGKKKFKLVKIN